MCAVPVGDVTRAGSLIGDWFLRKTHLLSGLLSSPGYLQLQVTSPGQAGLAWPGLAWPDLAWSGLVLERHPGKMMSRVPAIR